MFNSVKSRLMLLVSFILLGTILSILVATNKIVEDFQSKKLNDELNSTEDVLNTLITAQLSNLQTQSELLGELPILATVVDNGDIKTIKDTGGTYKDNLNIPIFDVLDADAELLVSLNSSFDESEGQIQKLLQNVLDGKSQSTIAIRQGHVTLLGLAPIGLPDDPSGVLVLGTYLDTEFAAKVKSLTGSDVSFLINSTVHGTSLPSEMIENTIELANVYFTSKNPSDDIYFGTELHVYLLNPLKDKWDNVLGHAVNQISLVESNIVKARIRFVLLIIGSVVFGVALLCGYWFSNTLTKPIGKAINFAHNLANGDTSTPIEVNRNDELGILQKSLEQMRQSLREFIDNLDQKVKERTAELAVAQKDIENILNNLDSGFLTFTEDGTIQPGYSRTSEDFFGQDLSGKTLSQLLNVSSRECDSIQNWLSILFGEALPFEDAVPLGPTDFEKTDGRFVELTYRPIYDNGTLKRVILVATDKTEERHLQLVATREKARADFILKIVNDREGFVDFIADTRNIVEALNKRICENEDITQCVDEIYRGVHTIKGNSSMYSTTTITEIAHELESDLSHIKNDNGNGIEAYLPQLQQRAKEILDALDVILEENKSMLGSIMEHKSGMRSILVDAGEFLEFESRLVKEVSSSSSIYTDFLDLFALEPFLPHLKKYEIAMQRIADREDKLLKPVTWIGDNVMVRFDVYKHFVLSLIHVFRNAVDHGIEDPDTRERRLKDPEGQITVQLERGESTNSSLKLTIADDGGGIDPQKLRKKIIDKNILDEKHVNELTDSEVLQYIFYSGLSTSEIVTDISGRGIGMDAIKHEATLLDGKVFVESELGKGTNVTINLPYIDVLNHRKKVLAVDDDRTVRAFIQKKFSRDRNLKDYQLTIVESAEQAMVELKNQAMDLIIVDWMLPNISGLDFVKFLRANKCYKDVPIIMVSMIDDDEKIQDAINAGVNRYITKPIDKNNLLYSVKSALDDVTNLEEIAFGAQNTSVT